MADNEKIESTEEEPEVVAHLASEEGAEASYEAPGWCITN